jgi:hypothetical protein
MSRGTIRGSNLRPVEAEYSTFYSGANPSAHATTRGADQAEVIENFNINKDGSLTLRRGAKLLQQFNLPDGSTILGLLPKPSEEGKYYVVADTGIYQGVVAGADTIYDTLSLSGFS